MLFYQRDKTHAQAFYISYVSDILIITQLFKNFVTS